MKLKDQVVRLDLAKELKALGVKQDSIWLWVEAPCRDGGYECRLSWNVYPYIETYSAYSVAELGEVLPEEIYAKMGGTTTNMYLLDYGKIDFTPPYYVRYIKHVIGTTLRIMRGNTEADVRAKMLIYLLKEGLVKEEELEK